MAVSKDVMQYMYTSCVTEGQLKYMHLSRCVQCIAHKCLFKNDMSSNDSDKTFKYLHHICGCSRGSAVDTTPLNILETKSVTVFGKVVAFCESVP
jgi:hypothetical protein